MPSRQAHNGHLDRSLFAASLARNRPSVSATVTYVGGVATLSAPRVTPVRSSCAGRHSCAGHRGRSRTPAGCTARTTRAVRPGRGGGRAIGCERRSSSVHRLGRARFASSCTERRGRARQPDGQIDDAIQLPGRHALRWPQSPWMTASDSGVTVTVVARAAALRRGSRLTRTACVSSPVVGRVAFMSVCLLSLLDTSFYHAA